MKSRIQSIIIFLVIVLYGCDEGIQKGSELKPGEINYIRSLGLLKEDEKIIYFSSNSSTEESGNFISDKRVGSYWINEKESKKHSAFFKHIDSINVFYMSPGNEYTTWIKVYHGRSWFGVYIDGERKAEEAFVAELENRTGQKAQAKD